MLNVSPRIVVESRPVACPYVLLVDDHEPSLALLHRVVAEAGHHCVTAASAARAVRYCEARRPQVVVTDLSMPNLDGCGLADWLSTRYPSIPMILMTGQVLEPRTLEAMRRRFTAVLPKPVNIESLLDRIDRLMPAPRIPPVP